MISYILLVVSVIGVILLYSFIVINYFINKKKFIDNYSGFDVAKEVTTNYEMINIVKSSDIVVSEYDIKRNVIRLNDNNYEGNSYFDILISSILAGYSLVNSENPDSFKFSLLFKKIRWISFSSLIMVILSIMISNIGDAKIGIVIFILLLVYQYMRYQIAINSNLVIKENLDKELYNKLEKSLGMDITINKVSFILSLIMILRLVVIILEI